MQESSFREVRAITPPAAYIGGKRQLAKVLVPLLSEIHHTAYAEPFCGMGGIFFRRTRAAPAEAINDVSRDVATLFRILQRHYPFFMQMLQYGMTSRVEFERLIATDPDTLTDLERAARFLYLQRLSFGGRVDGRTFGIDPLRPARFDVTRLGPILEAIHSRLAGVVIECLPYQRFLTRYDRPGMLFYLDPPYWGCETDYGRGVFGREDFMALADLLAGLKARWVLSINDRPEIRAIFGQFRLEPVELTYSLSRGAATKAKELIIQPW